MNDISKYNIQYLNRIVPGNTYLFKVEEKKVSMTILNKLQELFLKNHAKAVFIVVDNMDSFKPIEIESIRSVIKEEINIVLNKFKEVLNAST